MNFDTWASGISEQMDRKGHGFDPTDRWRSAALVGLVNSEIMEAVQEIKRHFLAKPELVAGELADALIRLGHFASVVGVRFAVDDRFVGLLGFNDLGDQQREENSVSDRSNFWFVLNEALCLPDEVQRLHSYWQDSAWQHYPNGREVDRFGVGLRRVTIDLCVFARNYGLDLDAAMLERIEYNETRPKGYNIATGQMS